MNDNFINNSNLQYLEFEKPYFSELIQFLDNEKKQSKVILPAEGDVFNAFNYCPFDKTKVVIIGQGIQFEFCP